MLVILASVAREAVHGRRSDLKENNEGFLALFTLHVVPSQEREKEANFHLKWRVVHLLPGGGRGGYFVTAVSHFEKRESAYNTREGLYDRNKHTLQEYITV